MKKTTFKQRQFLENTITENYYLVKDKETSEINVYSKLSRRVLHPTINKNGYRLVTVRDKDKNPITMNYARLLMVLTLPRQDAYKLLVDHINRDKLDDRLENLRWLEPEENTRNRKFARRPHRNTPIILLFDDGRRKEYSHKYRNKIDIPYITIYTLANRKEGTNYSKKYKMTCYYKGECERRKSL